MSVSAATLRMVLAVIGCLLVTAATAGVTPHPGQSLDGTQSIGDLIAKSGSRPVHIIFVHGIRALGPGSSKVFQREMCRLISPCVEQAAPKRVYLDVGDAPPAQVAGVKVWRNADEWRRSRPFVDRRIYRVGDRATVIVDEVNWWPLVFPLKCRFLLAPEIALSGPDRENLSRCARDDETFYPWVSPEQIHAAIRARSKRGGGAWVNNVLKHQIMNWGLSDAVIALGPMQIYFRRAVDGAFGYAGRDETGAEVDDDYVVVAESLGSFIVMDAFAAQAGETNNARTMLMQSGYNIYFFANQLRLLSLARLWNPGAVDMAPDAKGMAQDAMAERPAPMSALEDWASAGAPAGPGAGPARVRQIIAFNDPNDPLTYEVPQIPNAKVVNLFDRNAMTWLWSVENPVAAHTGHSRNKAVLKILFGRRSTMTESAR